MQKPIGAVSSNTECQPYSQIARDHQGKELNLILGAAAVKRRKISSSGKIVGNIMATVISVQPTRYKVIGSRREPAPISPICP